MCPHRSDVPVSLVVCLYRPVGAGVRRQHPAVHLPGAAAGRLRALVLGGGVRAPLDRALPLRGGAAVRHHLRRHSAEDAQRQPRAEADLGPHRARLQLPHTAHTRLPGEAYCSYWTSWFVASRLRSYFVVGTVDGGGLTSLLTLPQVLLANKLDELSTLSYFATVSPLFITFLTLMLMSFSSKPNNHCEL